MKTLSYSLKHTFLYMKIDCKWGGKESNTIWSLSKRLQIYLCTRCNIHNLPLFLFQTIFYKQNVSCCFYNFCIFFCRETQFIQPIWYITIILCFPFFLHFFLSSKASLASTWVTIIRKKFFFHLAGYHLILFLL